LCQFADIKNTLTLFSFVNVTVPVTLPDSPMRRGYLSSYHLRNKAVGKTGKVQAKLYGQILELSMVLMFISK